MFAVSAGCCLVAILYALFMLDESLQPPGDRSSGAAGSGGGGGGGVVASSLLYLLDGLRTVARPRHGHRSDSTVKQTTLVLAFTANCHALYIVHTHTDGCCCGWGCSTTAATHSATRGPRAPTASTSWRTSESQGAPPTLTSVPGTSGRRRSCPPTCWCCACCAGPASGCSPPPWRGSSACGTPPSPAWPSAPPR